ncbi:MAG: NAD(P)/FAD-dependent oxidoreductase [Chloroflexi bacterium]|nr:NAD(P)/FAD-dependent oxidoreductase [Chloroflexota bacterium]
MQPTRYLIVGNGAAGVTAAETIRQNDPLGEITIVGMEPHPMYSRPGLAYLFLNEISQRQIFARQPEWYQQLRLNLLFGKAVRLDADRQEVGLEDGRILPYDRLLIAAGARAIPPPYPGADLKGVHYLDTLAGTKALMKQAKRRRRAVVIGGGITALEMTEGLAHHGVDTHYFLRRDRLWGKVFNVAEAKILEKRMRHHGVTIHYNTEATEILGDRRGRVRAVRLKNGDEFKCNLVGVAIGVRPLLDLVLNTPIQTNRAILVDETMQTNVHNIYAAGDCAQVYDHWTRQHMLDILWPSAVAEGHAAGLNMVGQRQIYQKGSPFNACLLFGLHIATMGQINPRPGQEMDESKVVQYLSRGSSEVWYTYPRHYASAWSEDGDNTVRLVLDGDYLVGALLVGDQSAADPLRYIIENRINFREVHPDLSVGGLTLKRSVQRFWAQNSNQQPARSDQ